ncbi:hypothetical protein RUM44_013485 [Polyplax serrata]|uniref:Uncharacterized protein n=1 Tax=Polyplax serrata TaxID=468196 RepID=A0ABR1BGH8_POLSC
MADQKKVELPLPEGSIHLESNFDTSITESIIRAKRRLTGFFTSPRPNYRTKETIDDLTTN